MAAATKDAVLGSAVDLAREVAIELAEDPADVGDYLGMVVEGERLVSHRFASTARGYRGWEWTVTVARVPRGRVATVCEAELLPGPDAVLGQAWLPWSERIRPGDIGPGDVLPFRADDPRLEPGWTPSGDPELDSVAIDELALARVRVLSPEGRDQAAERWYRGPHGPTSAGAVVSTAACYSCGFLVPLQGALGTVFGVCANEWSPDDGSVVSLDHGCGAHSETDVETAPTDWPAPDPLIDELKLELVPPAAHAGVATADGAAAAVDATDATGTTAAVEAPEAADATDATAATEAPDSVDADAVTDVLDPIETGSGDATTGTHDPADAVAATEAPDATNVVDSADVLDPSETADALEPTGTVDVLDPTDTADVHDPTDTADVHDPTETLDPAGTLDALDVTSAVDTDAAPADAAPADAAPADAEPVTAGEPVDEQGAADVDQVDQLDQVDRLDGRSDEPDVATPPEP